MEATYLAVPASKRSCLWSKLAELQAARLRMPARLLALHETSLEVAGDLHKTEIPPHTPQCQAFAHKVTSGSPDGKTCELAHQRAQYHSEPCLRVRGFAHMFSPIMPQLAGSAAAVVWRWLGIVLSSTHCCSLQLDAQQEMYR